MENEQQPILSNALTAVLGAAKAYSDQLEGQQVLEPVRLGTKFFSTRKRVEQDALEESNAEYTLSVSGESIEYVLKAPSYIELIRFDGKTAAPVIDLEVIKLGADQWHTLRVKPSGDDPNVAFAEVHSFVQRFRIKSANRGWTGLKKEHLSSILVMGWQQDDLNKVPSEIARLEKEQQSLRKLLDEANEGIAARRESLEADIKRHLDQATASKKELESERQIWKEKLEGLEEQEEQLSTEAEALKGTIKEETQALEKLQKSVAAEKASQEALQSRISELQKSERELLDLESLKNREIQTLNTQVTKLKEDIRQLNNDKSLFAEDMVGFTRHARLQMLGYIVLSLIPTGAGIWGALSLMGRVGTATTAYIASEGKLNIGALFLGELSVVLAEITLLIFCYFMARFFAQEAISLNRKRVDLSQISILSRDTTDSALHGSKYSDEEREQVRIAIRMYFVRLFFTGGLTAIARANREGTLPELPPTLMTIAWNMLPARVRLAIKPKDVLPLSIEAEAVNKSTTK